MRTPAAVAAGNRRLVGPWGGTARPRQPVVKVTRAALRAFLGSKLREARTTTAGLQQREGPLLARTRWAADVCGSSALSFVGEDRRGSPSSSLLAERPQEPAARPTALAPRAARQQAAVYGKPGFPEGLRWSECGPPEDALAQSTERRKRRSPWRQTAKSRRWK